jgi:hypothetical protein
MPDALRRHDEPLWVMLLLAPLRVNQKRTRLIHVMVASTGDYADLIRYR